MIYTIFWKKFSNFGRFLVKDSAETSAEASVDLAEASVSAESLFRAFRSFTRKGQRSLVFNRSSKLKSFKHFSIFVKEKYFLDY